MKKNLSFVLVMILLLAVSAVCADDLSDVRQNGVLRFGAPLEYIPFVFEDETGSASGMDVALMEEICRRMGLRMQKLSFARDGIIDALTIGQIDVIGGGLSKTDARSQVIDFSRTYYNGEAQVISLASSPKPQVVNLDSFRGMKIAVVKGSSFQEWVQTNLVDTGIMSISSVYTFTDSADGMKALDRKDVDLIMIDQDVYEDRYRPSGNYQVFYSGFKTENYAFGMRKNSSLTAEINNQLNEMIKDGTAQSIANRFFSMNYTDKASSIVKPVATLAPVVTVAPTTCVNAMSYVADVTVKDGQTFRANEGFRKTWRIYNNGSCTWDSNYTLQLVSGDAMNGSYVRIPTTVQPGQIVDVSVDLKAPSNAGNYKGYWQMRSPQGSGFGQTIWVNIKVSGSAPVPTATPQDGQTRTIPVIDYFYADSYSGKSGDATVIHWGTTRAAGVSIVVDGYQISNEGPSGSYQLQAPIQGKGTHEIKLIARSVTDDATSVIYYNMDGGDGQERIIPKINYFYASSTEGKVGDSTTVYWSVENSNGVDLMVDGNFVERFGQDTGSATIYDQIQNVGSHEIQLLARSVTDDAYSSVWYMMNGQTGLIVPDDGQTQVIPVINSFSADSYSGYPGDGTTIYWSTSNAGGVTISVDGYEISNEGASGSYQLQAPLQGAGSHSITLTAHSVTDDTSQTIYYTMNEYATGLDVNFDDTYDMTEQDWQDFGDALDSMTEEDWNQVFDSMTEEDWNDFADAFAQMSDEDWAALAELMGDEY